MHADRAWHRLRPGMSAVPTVNTKSAAVAEREADECGSMNEWLAAAPAAQLTRGMMGCRVSVGDMADRGPRVLSDGEVIDIGGKRFRYIDTPHVPHGWDAGVMFCFVESPLCAAVHPESLFLRSDNRRQKATRALHRMAFARLSPQALQRFRLGAHSVRVELPVQGVMELPTVQAKRTGLNQAVRFKQRL
jgi:hypothetical protein